MNWKTLLTPTNLAEAGLAAGLWVLATYKKEVQDGFKSLFSWCWQGLLGWLRRLIHQEAAQQAAVKKLEAAIVANRRALTTLLLLMEKDYYPDRVSITEWEECSDGSALVTCVVEVRQAEMHSVTDLQATPQPRPLWLVISHIAYLPGKALHVPDARLAESAVLQDALRGSGASSAYYQAIPDPQGEYKQFTLLALSWQQPHQLSAAELHALHQSGVACATVLSTRWQLLALKATLSGLGK